MSLAVCMIGCGSFATLCHGPAQLLYRARYPDARFSGCCDADGGRSRMFSDRFGYAHHYTDVSAMLSAERPDAVIVSVPPEATEAVGVPLMERGLALLLEKPPGLTTIELAGLAQAAQRGKAKTQVAFNRRYMPVVRRAMEILAGDTPPETIARIDYRMWRHSRWDHDFSTTAIHAIDAALFLARSPIQTARIYFQTQSCGARQATNVQVEAVTAAGTQIRIDIQPVTGRNLESVQINSLGRSMTITLPISPTTPESGRLECWRENERVALVANQDLEMVEHMGIFGELEAFLNGLAAGRPLSPRLEDCTQQVALMEAIRLRQSDPILPVPA